MTDQANTTPTPIQTTVSVLNTLIPLAASVVAMVGGVPVPIVEGLHVAQALLPTAESFALQIGGKSVTIDTSHANDPNEIIAALQKDAASGWPILTFLPLPPAGDQVAAS